MEPANESAVDGCAEQSARIGHRQHSTEGKGSQVKLAHRVEGEDRGDHPEDIEEVANAGGERDRPE